MGSYLTYYDGKHQFLGYKNKCEKILQNLIET